jgi:hypothetical protein
MGSQEHLNAQSLKKTQGLRTNCKFEESLFLSCKEWQQFLLEKSQASRKY